MFVQKNNSGKHDFFVKILHILGYFFWHNQKTSKTIFFTFWILFPKISAV